MISRRLLRRTTVEQLRKALALKLKLDRATALERQRAKLLKAVAKVEARIARLNGSTAKAGPVNRRRRFSKATRLKMAASQRARWAKKKNA